MKKEEVFTGRELLRRTREFIELYDLMDSKIEINGSIDFEKVIKGKEFHISYYPMYESLHKRLNETLKL